MEYLKEKLNKKYEIFESKYKKIGVIGKGAYGIVEKAVLLENKNVKVALKTFKSNLSRESEGISITVLREINVYKYFFKKKLINELENDNIINCREILVKDNSIIMVFDLAEYDLERLLKFHNSNCRIVVKTNNTICKAAKSLGIFHILNQRIICNEINVISNFKRN
jgi:serine/threonine protein kinase